MVNIQEIAFQDFKEVVGSSSGVLSEGMVFLGCAGSAEEWIQGISDTLYEEGISKNNNPHKLWGKFYQLETTNGRIDLVFMFNENFAKLFSQKLFIWRIAWGGCSWVSDYLVNYEKHFENAVC